MIRGFTVVFGILLICLLLGAPRIVHAQVDSLKPRVTLSFDSLTLDVYAPFRPPVIRAISYKGDSLPVDTLGKVDTAHVGTYTVGYYAVDSQVNRSDTAFLRVKVLDKKRPRLSLLGNLYMTLRLGRIYREPGISVTDNYDLNPTILTKGTFKDTKNTGLFYIVYQARDSSGNISDTAVRFIEVVDSAAVGIDEKEPFSSLGVYPNPASTQMSIEMGLPLPAEALLFSPSGALLRTIRFRNQSLLSVHDLSPGLYILYIRCGNAHQSVPVMIVK